MCVLMRERGVKKARLKETNFFNFFGISKTYFSVSTETQQWRQELKVLFTYSVFQEFIQSILGV